MSSGAGVDVWAKLASLWSVLLSFIPLSLSCLLLSRHLVLAKGATSQRTSKPGCNQQTGNRSGFRSTGVVFPVYSQVVAESQQDPGRHGQIRLMGRASLYCLSQLVNSGQWSTESSLVI
ncbi:hypothetical protein RRG08_020683 [Elysia crispata]|uniref:Uncharacterized protein n=1 Tax=Elysia crispata TaxID=231223 RepID=A0AAE0Z493_9GAST|nr:hypothetical protein RRG08_020683 [Elysia crispata]